MWEIIQNNWKLMVGFMIFMTVAALPCDWLIQVNETLGMIYCLLLMGGAVYAGVLFNIHVHKQRGDVDDE